MTIVKPNLLITKTRLPYGQSSHPLTDYVETSASYYAVFWVRITRKILKTLRNSRPNPSSGAFQPVAKPREFD
jgi:hypothetical protein